MPQGGGRVKQVIRDFMTNLVQTIALPNRHAPQRYPSFPALDRTAVMSFSVPSTVQVPSATTYEIMLSRQPAWPAWAPQTFTSMVQTTTYYNEPVTSSGQATYSSEIPGNLFSWYTGNATGNDAPRFTNAVRTFSYPIIGQDVHPTRVYTYVPPGANFYISVGSASATAWTNAQAMRVTYLVWTGPGTDGGENSVVVNIAAGANGGMSASIPNSTASWVCPIQVYGTQTAGTTPSITMATSIIWATDVVTFTNQAGTMGTLTVGANPLTLFMPLVAPAEFANSALPWSDTRVTATSLLATNVTQVLNKGGTVLCGRVSPAVFNPFLVTPTYVNALHPAEKAFLPLESGFYTFVPPSQDMLTFSNHTLPQYGVQLSSNTIPAPSPLYNLASTSLVHFMFITSATAAETMAVTVDWHLEFKTSSALFQIGVSPYSLEAMHQAQLTLARAPLFLSNFNHLAVLGALRVIGGGLMKAAKFGLNLLDPSLVRNAKQVYRRVTQGPTTRRPRTTVQTTTARRSGMLGNSPETAASQQMALSQLPPAGFLPTRRARPKRKGGLQMYLSRNRKTNRKK